MKFAVPSAQDQQRESLIDQNRVVSSDIASVFQNSYLSSVSNINTAKTNLNSALAAQAAAAKEGDALEYARQTALVSNLQLVLSQYQQNQKTLMANLPANGAFVAHITYCTIVGQQTKLGRKIL